MQHCDMPCYLDNNYNYTNWLLEYLERFMIEQQFGLIDYDL